MTVETELDPLARQLTWAAARGATGQTLYQLLGPGQGHVAAELAEDAADAVTQTEIPAAVREAAGLGVAAAVRYARNQRAQQDGRADPLGLDPSDRLRSWAGRHDGAE